MAWPSRCAGCRSRDVAAGAGHIQCNKCGRLTDGEGRLVPPEVQYGAATYTHPDDDWSK